MTHDITHIPLDEHSSLMWGPKPMWGIGYCWRLHSCGSLIRYLTPFEENLVNAAIAAAQEAKA